MVELQPLLTDTDLHIAQLTMNLLTSVAKLHKSSLPMVQKTSLAQIFHLSQSPLLQGAALNAMLEFFQVSKVHIFWKIHKKCDEIFSNPCLRSVNLEKKFWSLQFFQKTNLKKAYLGRIFCLFFGRIEEPKSPFEINWPLESAILIGFKWFRIICMVSKVQGQKT